jgi:hypothetical protein
MVDRAPLKCDPNPARKLENTVLRNHQAGPSPLPTPAALPGALEGGKVGPRKLVTGESRII